MRKDRTKSFRTTLLQRTSLEKIRVSLAEMGYRIFPVAARYRNHARDFVAIGPGIGHLLVVRPIPNGDLELRPYAHSRLHTDVKAMVRKYQSELVPIQWGAQLPDFDDTTNWKAYVPKKCGLELQLFLE